MLTNMNGTYMLHPPPGATNPYEPRDEETPSASVAETASKRTDRRRTVTVLSVALVATLLLALAGQGLRSVFIPIVQNLSASPATSPSGASKTPEHGGPGVYGYDDLGFEAWFPGTPKHRIEPDNIPGGNNDFHVFEVESKDRYYAVTASYRTWRDYDAWVDDMVAHPEDPEYQSRITARRDVHIDGVKALSVDLTLNADPSIVTYVAVVTAGEREYIIQSGGPNRQEWEEFLQSVRFLPESGGLDAATVTAPAAPRVQPLTFRGLS